MNLENFHIYKWLQQEHSKEIDLSSISDEEYYDWYYLDHADIDNCLPIKKNTTHYILNKLFILLIDYCVENDLCVDGKYLISKENKYDFYKFCYRNSIIKK